MHTRGAIGRVGRVERDLAVADAGVALVQGPHRRGGGKRGHGLGVERRPVVAEQRADVLGGVAAQRRRRFHVQLGLALDFGQRTLLQHRPHDQPGGEHGGDGAGGEREVQSGLEVHGVEAEWRRLVRRLAL